MNNMSKPVILFESYPDFNGSALAVYEELVKRGYEEKYDLVWAVYSDFNLKTNYKVVKFFNCNSPEKQDIIKRTKEGENLNWEKKSYLWMKAEYTELGTLISKLSLYFVTSVP